MSDKRQLTAQIKSAVGYLSNSAFFFGRFAPLVSSFSTCKFGALNGLKIKQSPAQQQLAFTLVVHDARNGCFPLHCHDAPHRCFNRNARGAAQATISRTTPRHFRATVLPLAVLHGKRFSRHGLQRSGSFMMGGSSQAPLP
ncbi:unnamed protein product [Mycetohabitans rhizoxinica HKI 454]|uniref:Uncharacterized protein n=2 Tax=Mycetohabitans rhizoxinica TaxID=412963 RepID=E5AKI1_MYCRK|nr:MULTISPECIES: hypothetical protein [Mycetohabitans]MCF7694622.1 hypothetical protein [Mycetohabitans sp. B2]MCG1045996.1 hypothetical protein [Mycetohabitans sp. B6]CBW73653.1 unnamed protein product [Mycetohabitans rhizoxinica HKI 454]